MAGKTRQVGSRASGRTHVSSTAEEHPLTAKEKDGSEGKVTHKLPLCACNWEEDGDIEESAMWKEEFASCGEKLLNCRNSMHDIRGQVTPGALWEMMEVVKTLLAEVMQELRRTKFRTHRSIVETLHPCDRDKLTNMGASVFACGMFIVLMSSNVKDDEHEAKVNEVLEKVLKTNGRKQKGLGE